jgi:hypothetical protein
VIIPSGYGQVNFVFGGSGFARGAQVTFGFKDNSGGATAATIATDFGTRWVNDILLDQSNTITLDHVKVKLGPNDTGPEATVSSGAAGGLSSQPLPPQDSVIVRKITALGGRKGRGRVFHPGAVESQTDGGGLLTTAAIVTLDGDYADLLAHAAADNLPLYLLHNDATTPTAIDQLDVLQLMGTQRRRIRKVGGRRS